MEGDLVCMTLPGFILDSCLFRCICSLPRCDGGTEGMTNMMPHGILRQPLLVRQVLSGFLQAGWQSRREPIIRFHSSYDSPDIQEPHYSDCIVPFIWHVPYCLRLHSPPPPPPNTHMHPHAHAHTPGDSFLCGHICTIASAVFQSSI